MAAVKIKVAVNGLQLKPPRRTQPEIIIFGAEQAFITRQEVIKVKTATGERRDTLLVKASVHGPVFQEDATTALAVRVAGLDDPNSFEQWWQMGGATSMAQFEGNFRNPVSPARVSRISLSGTSRTSCGTTPARALETG